MGENLLGNSLLSLMILDSWLPFLMMEFFHPLPLPDDIWLPSILFPKYLIRFSLYMIHRYIYFLHPPLCLVLINEKCIKRGATFLDSLFSPWNKAKITKSFHHPQEKGDVIIFRISADFFIKEVSFKVEQLLSSLNF